MKKSLKHSASRVRRCNATCVSRKRGSNTNCKPHHDRRTLACRKEAPEAQTLLRKHLCLLRFFVAKVSLRVVLVAVPVSPAADLANRWPFCVVNAMLYRRQCPQVC